MASERHVDGKQAPEIQYFVLCTGLMCQIKPACVSKRCGSTLEHLMRDVGPGL